MNFAEIIYQSALFTATFFIFNKLFSRYVFKNREQVSVSTNQIIKMFFMYLVLSLGMKYISEKYFAPVLPSNTQEQTLISGQNMLAPKIEDVVVPLKTEIEFDLVEQQEPQLMTITTHLAEYVFSSHGATLHSLNLLWHNGKKIELLPKSNDDTLLQNFFIACNQKSPVNFEMVKSEPSVDGNTHEIVYVARSGRATIQKTFVLHNNTYQFDIKVEVSGLPAEQQIRLLVPQLVQAGQLEGITNIADSSKLQKISLTKPETFNQFWFNPKLFGFCDRHFNVTAFAYSPIAVGRAYFKKVDTDLMQVIFESRLFDNQAEMSWSFYFGPNVSSDLQAVSPALSNIIDYGFLSFLAKPLAKSLCFINQFVGNYGWAIILITILLKLLMVPFTLRGERGMRQQAEFEKKRQHLQQKYKHDKAALEKATADLIAKHGLPILSSCLPMLLNIPVLIALNKVLTNSTELYGASFLWLPDLSAADPYYILSLITFIGMAFAPSMQTGPRQMFSRLGFALIVGTVTSYLASGLALFVLCNTLFGFAQTWVVNQVKSLR